jgi:hypothetical protein
MPWFHCWWRLVFGSFQKASILKDGTENAIPDGGKTVKKSTCGHYYLPPDSNVVCVFQVSGSKFLKLNKETWHAGPLFKTRAKDFYNLGLSNTNVSSSLARAQKHQNYYNRVYVTQILKAAYKSWYWVSEPNKTSLYMKEFFFCLNRAPINPDMYYFSYVSLRI